MWAIVPIVHECGRFFDTGMSRPVWRRSSTLDLRGPVWRRLCGVPHAPAQLSVRGFVVTLGERGSSPGASEASPQSQVGREEAVEDAVGGGVEEDEVAADVGQVADHAAVDGVVAVAHVLDDVHDGG